MARTEKEKASKKKKKPKKKRKDGLFEWLFMGTFSIFMVILLIGFTGTLVI